MDRIINVKVGGNHLSKDNKNAGVRGEANVTSLRITFDEGWVSWAKKVTFWDALGNNPVERTLTLGLLEDIKQSARIYIVPIPGEAMAEAGELTFVIDGYDEGKRQRSIADTLVVKDAPIADNAGQPTDPTPTQAEQLQGQIDDLMFDIQGEVIQVAKLKSETNVIKDETAAIADQARESALSAQLSASQSDYAATQSDYHAKKAELEAAEAEYARIKAHEALGKTNYIGENGNWFAWDSVAGAFYDTKVKAQSGSTVYCGENPPDDADVWIFPDGTPEGYYNIGEVDALLNEVRSSLVELSNKVAPSPASITLYSDATKWVQVSDKLWRQEVVVKNAEITPYSKVDLQLNAVQLAAFYEKDIALVTENDGGKVYVYCIGSGYPKNTYEIQVAVSEVVVNG